MPRLPRPIYIVYRLLEALVSVTSRFLNATFFGGSTYQSLSARAFIDGQSSPKWAARRVVIDRLFFFHADHCRKYWEAEVDAARKTLDRAGV